MEGQPVCPSRKQCHNCYARWEDVLNLTPSVAFSLLVRGSMVDLTVMPLARASAGMSERNSRAGFERGLNGLKVTRTSVRKRVSMLAAVIDEGPDASAER